MTDGWYFARLDTLSRVNPVGRAAPRGELRGRAPAIPRLHLRPARRPRTRTRELQGDHPRRPPCRGPQAAEPLALGGQCHQGREGRHAGRRRQSRRSQRGALHVAHLRHRAGAGPRRRTEEPHGQVPRLRPAGSQRVDRHPAVQGARIEEARHPRHRRVRQRPAARRHRVQEPHHRRRVEGRGGQAAPPLPGGRHALEGPGGAEAVRGGADSHRDLRRARRLRHGRNVGTVLPRMERAVSPGREPARQGARTPADAPGRPALRAPRAAQHPRYRAQFRRVRGRRRPGRPQADPLQAVHRRERGATADPDLPETERARRNRLAHAGVGEEPDDALAGAQAPPRGRRNSNPPSSSSPTGRSSTGRLPACSPHAGSRTPSGRPACAACGRSSSIRPARR